MIKTIGRKILSFDQFCHFFDQQKLSLQVFSYGYLNEASGWDKFSDDNFLKVDSVLKMMFFC